MKYFFFLSMTFLLLTSCNTEEKRIKVEGLMYMEISIYISETAPIKDSIGKLSEYGWSINGSRLELIAPQKNMVLKTSNGQSITADSNGYIEDAKLILKEEKDGLDPLDQELIKKGFQPIQFPKVKCQNSDIHLYLTNDKNGNKVIRYQIEYGSMPDCCKGGYIEVTQSDSLACLPPDPSNNKRCLDYNGIWTDGCNYNRKINKRAYVNFIGSDCNISMLRGMCWEEYLCGKNCYKLHGNKTCSVLINHPTEYHTH